MTDFNNVINEVNEEYPEFDYLLEIYTEGTEKKQFDKSIDPRDVVVNNTNLGLTICYPNSSAATHIYSFQEKTSINENEFKDKVLEICQNLRSKI